MLSKVLTVLHQADPTHFVRRPLSFLLLLVYLLSSPGLGYSMHYCGRVLTGVSVLAESPKTCCPPHQAPCGSCHDKHVSSPADDATLLAAASLAALVPALVPPPLAWTAAARPKPWPTEPERQRPPVEVRAAASPPRPAYVRGHAFRL